MSACHINPVLWEQSLGYARAHCARLFRDGGTPTDALKALGLSADGAPQDWAIVIDRIAVALAEPSVPRRMARAA